jgi:hypothetical protein
MREQIVDEILNEIQVRLEGLDMTGQELVLTALHGLRAHQADVLKEFDSNPSNDDDDPSTTDEVGRLIGGLGGAAAGAALGGKLVRPALLVALWLALRQEVRSAETRRRGILRALLPPVPVATWPTRRLCELAVTEPWRRLRASTSSM